MYTTISDRGKKGLVLVIHAAERLDFSQHQPFCKACEESLTRAIHRIDIDMDKTTQIYDSGIGMLLMLARKAGKAGGIMRKIRIINCRADLRQRLARADLPSYFQVA